MAQTNKPKGWGLAGTIVETGATDAIGPCEYALIILGAGGATVDIEVQPPESSDWVKAEIGLDASSDVVKVFHAPACKIRLNATAYTSDVSFWLIESSNKS